MLTLSQPVGTLLRSLLDTFFSLADDFHDCAESSQTHACTNSPEACCIMMQTLSKTSSNVAKPHASCGDKSSCAVHTRSSWSLPSQMHESCDADTNKDQ